MEAQIRSELNRVDALRANLIAAAKSQNEDPYAMVGMDGQYLMTPLVVARSNLLLAMAIHKGQKRL